MVAARTGTTRSPELHVRRHDRVELVDPGQPGWRLPVALGAVVVALVLAVWTWSGELFGRHVVEDLPRIELPSVAALDIEAAERELEALGFVVAIVPRPNEIVPKGTAFGQEPVAGRKLEQGELVSILVSDGPAGIVVPTVTGRQVAEVQALLAADGLGTSVTGAFDELLPPGEVISSKPAAGERIDQNGTVELVISFGPAPRTVPGVVGIDVHLALVAIGRAGLAVGDIDRVYVEGQPERVVLEADPPPGAQAPREMPVDLKVTGPPPKVTVRPFTGLTQASATTVARATGVTLDVITTPVPAGDPRVGRVIAQGVPPFVQVNSGSTVQVTVGVAS